MNQNLFIVAMWLSLLSPRPADQEGTITDPVTPRPAVVVSAAVYRSREGTPILGLACKDFVLQDNREPQSLISCDPIGGAPVQLVLVVDSRSLSVSMDRQLRKDLERGLGELAKGSRVALVLMDYGDIHVHQSFTSDTKTIAAILANRPRRSGLISNAQQTFDAIAVAAKHHQTVAGGVPRIIVCLSDDRELRSTTTYAAAIDEAFAANSAVYHLVLDTTESGPVTFPVPVPRPRISQAQTPFPVQSFGMTQIVERTGGEQVRLSSSPTAFASLLSRIRHRYLLTFMPTTNSPNPLHRVSVELTDEARQRFPGATVRAPAGYSAGR